MTTHSALWRRLDTPGHDACRLAGTEHGWELAGTAVFRHHGEAVRLSYRLACDPAWHARRGEVRGFVGADAVDLAVERTASGAWNFDGRACPGLEGCTHLDLGFTPATNLPQLRQLALQVGDAADLPVAWLDVPPSDLLVLPQRYERRSEEAYWYEAPSVGYAAVLELAPSGFVRRYPGLWVIED